MSQDSPSSSNVNRTAAENSAPVASSGVTSRTAINQNQHDSQPEVPLLAVAAIWSILLGGILGGTFLLSAPDEETVSFTLDSAISKLEQPVADPEAVRWLVSHSSESIDPLLAILHEPLITEEPSPELIQRNAADVLSQIGRPARVKLEEALANVRQQQSDNKRLTQRVGMFGGNVNAGLHFSRCLIAVERNILTAMK